MQIGVITNPNSRKNQSKARRAEALQQVVGPLGQVHQTPDVDAIKPVLRRFLRQGTRYWVSDGGDGALHWMLRKGMEVLEEEEFAGRSLGFPLAMPTNGGSIDFVAHNAGLKGNAETLLSALRRSLEAGETLEEVEVDAMLVEGLQRDERGHDVPFRTLGFASAAGGVGQRFFLKLFEEGHHTSKTILTVLAKTLASYPVASSPLEKIPGMPRILRTYSKEMFRPTEARVLLDGEPLPRTDCTGIHIASMSINLGNVFRFFHAADTPGQLHAIVGSPTPGEIIRNMPWMFAGKALPSDNIYDGPCRTMTMEAAGPELLAPIIDGELYPDVVKVTFSPGPKLRIPRVVPTARDKKTLN